MSPKKLLRLQDFYNDTKLFIIDEINTMSNAMLA